VWDPTDEKEIFKIPYGSKKYVIVPLLNNKNKL